jgi:tRNA(Ile)-lysidine synthase
MTRLNATEKSVLATIREYDMIRSGDTVIVAVSGGPDSVCLLQILLRLRENLKINVMMAHLDHGLRPGEDEREAEFVETLAKELGITYACERSTQLANARGSCLEEKAREIRYGFFEGVLNTFKAQRIALGHNKNDQAETVIMNMLRGSGSAGLSGMPPIRDKRYIRPLIGITREEILSYIREKGLVYMTDSSNLDKQYLRNRIRLELMPILLTYQPKLIDHLEVLAFLCREEDFFMDREAERWLQEMVRLTSGQSFDISIEALKGIPVALQYRVIRAAIQRVKGNLRRINFGHIRTIIDLMKNPRAQLRTDLPEHLVVKKVYTKLRFCVGEEMYSAAFSYPIASPGRYYIDSIKSTITCEEISRADFSGRSPSDWQCFLDLETLRWPFIIRNYMPGDRFMPLGLRGFKKLKDLFIDKKIAHEQRKSIPILESNGDIAWVGGIRIDHRYRVREDTKRILRCKIE